MLKRLAIVAVSLLAAAPAFAGKLEDRVEERWRGAWVVVDAELRSDCDGRYTDNRINGRMSQSRGRHWFEAGELAQIDDIDVLRSRVDVKLSIDAPLRVSWQDGPFTLFDHVSCRAELEVEVPRAVVKSRDAGALQRYLERVMEPHATFDAARASDGWSGREAEPFPPDYDRTLAEYEIFKVERHNAAIDARLAASHERLEALSHSVHGEGDYVDGLAAGIAEQRAVRRAGCTQLVSGALPATHRRHRHGHDDDDAAPSEAWLRGFDDGRALVFHLDVIARASGCYLPVPPHPETTVQRDAPEAEAPRAR